MAGKSVVVVVVEVVLELEVVELELVVKEVVVVSLVEWVSVPVPGSTRMSPPQAADRTPSSPQTLSRRFWVVLSARVSLDMDQISTSC